MFKIIGNAIGRILDYLTRGVEEDERRLAAAGIESITTNQRSIFRSLQKGDTIIIDGNLKKIKLVEEWGDEYEFGGKNRYLDITFEDAEMTLNIHTDIKHHIRYLKWVPSYLFFRQIGTKGWSMPFRSLEIPSKGVRLVASPYKDGSAQFQK